MSFDGNEDAKQLKKEIKKRNRPIMASNRVQDYCMHCPDNEDMFLLSASNYVYLALPKHKTFDGFFHFILAPVDHEQTSIGLNEDILTELNNYRKCLIQAFDKYDLQVVFF
jgi:DNA-binding cell septation regulator SpoVG